MDNSFDIDICENGCAEKKHAKNCNEIMIIMDEHTCKLDLNTLWK